MSSKNIGSPSACFVIVQRASSEALVPHLPGLLHGRPDPAPQDPGPQGTRAYAPWRRLLRVLSPRQGLGRRRPRLGVKVSASLCLCGAVTRECGFSMSQSCFFSGLQSFPVCPAWQSAISPCRSAVGLTGLLWWLSSLPVFSLSCLSLAICHPISEPAAEAGYLLPVIWDRGRVQPADYRWGGLQVGGEVSSGAARLHVETLPATHMVCPLVPRSPNSPCDLSALFATATSRPPASLWSM